MRKLRNNSSGISLAKATAAVVREIVSGIAGIRNEAVLNKNAGDPLLACTTNHSELVAYFHLENTTIGKAHGSKVIHNLIGKLNRNLCIV